MAGNFSSDYDYRENILYIHSTEKKADHSVDLGEMAVDVDKDGRISGVEIFSASKTLSELTNRKITRQELKKISQVSLTSSPKKGTVLIRVVLQLEKETSLMMAIQNPKYKSHAIVSA